MKNNIEAFKKAVESYLTSGQTVLTDITKALEKNTDDLKTVPALEIDTSYKIVLFYRNEVEKYHTEIGNHIHVLNDPSKYALNNGKKRKNLEMFIQNLTEKKSELQDYDKKTKIKDYDGAILSIQKYEKYGREILKLCTDIRNEIMTTIEENDTWDWWDYAMVAGKVGKWLLEGYVEDQKTNVERMSDRLNASPKPTRNSRMIRKTQPSKKVAFNINWDHYVQELKNITKDN